MIGQAERLYELNRLTRGKSKKNHCPIIAFTSGKGGTGKSFVTLNLAYALSRINKKVLLVDLDANLSNINIMLNIRANKTLYSFFQDIDLFEELIYRYEPNLHFIFGDSGKTDYPILNDTNMKELFNQFEKISKEYDYIFIDTGAGAGKEVLSILGYTDGNIIVSTPEPTSVMDAYVIVKLLNKNGVNTPRHVIINKSASLKEGNAAFENLNNASKHFLNEELNMLGIIEYGDEAGRSILNQELLLKSASKTRIARQIIALANGFAKIKQVANSNQ